MKKIRPKSSFIENHHTKYLSSISKNKLEKYESAFRNLDPHHISSKRSRDLVYNLARMRYDINQENIYYMISELDDDDCILSQTEFLIGMVKKEKSIYIQNLRRVSKEIIRAKRKEKLIILKTHKIKKCFHIDNGEFKEILELSDILDIEYNREICLKIFNKYSTEMQFIFGLEDGTSLKHFVDSSKFNMNFGHYPKSIKKYTISFSNLSKIKQKISIFFINAIIEYF